LRSKVKARIQEQNEHPKRGWGNPIHTPPNNSASKAHAQRAVAQLYPDSDDDDEDVDDDSAVGQVSTLESTMRDIFGGMARMETSDQVRCNLEYCDRLAYLTRSPRAAYAIADSGANTKVLGKGTCLRGSYQKN
jgi:hypothetical protein